MKEKIKDIWDDTVWYLYYKPIDIYKTIRAWLRYNWHKERWQLIKSAFNSYPYDGYYIDEIVWRKLEDQYKYFKSNPGFCSNEHYAQINKWLGLACKLAYIITHEDELWDGNGDVFDGTWKSYSKVKVNLKNKNRFAYKYIDPDNSNKIGYTSRGYDHSPWELYIKKSRRLLYRIIEEYGEEWWD